MGVACVTLSILLRKGRYVWHLQWDSMKKGPTDWVDLYASRVMEMGDTVYARGGGKFT